MGLLRSSNVHQVCTLLCGCVIQQEQNVNKKCPESHKVSEKWRNQKVTITTLAKLVWEFVRFVRSVYENHDRQRKKAQCTQSEQELGTNRVQKFGLITCRNTWYACR